MINEDTYNRFYFKKEELEAFISLEFDCQDNGQLIQYFLVNLVENQGLGPPFIQKFQKSFDSIDRAIDHLIQAYGHFDLVDRLDSNSGGCASCQAH